MAVMQKVAIAGYGVEGEASYNYWNNLGAYITIFDSSETPSRPIPEGVTAVLGPDAFDGIQGFDIVVRTASLRPDEIIADSKIWSATNEFFEKCPAPIIGVTGTKGKGTTCSLIAEILSNDDKVVHLLGNIGVPALEVLPKITPDDIVVFELSSFQLWDLQKSPQTAVVLMIEPDHMDVHASMEEYVGAKANIAKYQDTDDVVIYHPDNRYALQIAEHSSARKKQYMKPSGAYIIGGQVVVGDVAVAKTEEVSLVGGHNLENVCAAITAAWEYTKNVTAIQYAIKDFKGLPHRLEFVRDMHGIEFYNDSYSSAPGATIAAIKSFTQPEILICGGFDRGLDYTSLAEAAAQQGNIKKILLIGQTKEKIAESLTKAGFSRYEVLDSVDFTEIITHARDIAEQGDVVVLSPGCASFDMFKNFQERGEKFKEIVGSLQ
jgi:UDP-N-acetylmuramoylalanine--D-glutamate ligase